MTTRHHENERGSQEVMREIYRLEEYRLPMNLESEIGPTKMGVAYGRAAHRDLRGTLFLPKHSTGSSAPSVVYLHGGGWVMGNREQFLRHAAVMTTVGFAGLCIDYRLADEKPYPAAIQDAKCAVRYLRANAPRFGLDPERIGAVGGSAGAHLAGCLATTPDKEEWEGDGGHQGHSSAIQAAVHFNGEFDLPAWWQYGKPECNQLMLEFLGVPYEEAPELYRDASPIKHVSEKMPPCLLLHGEADTVVPISQSIEFCTRVRSVGGHCELIRVPKVNHAWFNRAPHFQPCLEALMAFLVEQLGSS